MGIRIDTTLKLKAMFIHDIAPDTTQVRPQFVMTLTGQNMQAAMEELDSIPKMANISNAELAKNLVGMLEYSGKFEEALPIPEGWDTPRCAFGMFVEHESPMGIAINFFISGFTNRRPVNTLLEGQEIDWTGVDFHVNYITALRTVVMMTPDGPRKRHQVGSSNLVLADRSSSSRFKCNRIRPGDVFSTLTSLEMMQADPQIVDTRTLVTSLGVFSNAEHAIPAVWLGEILRGYGQAAQFDDHFDVDTVHRNARGTVVEQSTAQDPFMRAIGQFSGISTTSISMALLRRMFANLDEVATYVTSPNEETPVYIEGRTEWHPAAMLVGLGTTGLMASLGLSVIHFQATNNTDSPTPLVVVSDLRSMFEGEIGDADMSIVIEQFKKRFIEEILPQVSYNGQQPFELQVTAHIGGNTQVIIGSGMAGEEKHVRNIASYADSLLTPLIYSYDQDKERLNLVTDVSNLLNAIPPALTPSTGGV